MLKLLSKPVTKKHILTIKEEYDFTTKIFLFNGGQNILMFNIKFYRSSQFVWTCFVKCLQLPKCGPTKSGFSDLLCIHFQGFLVKRPSQCGGKKLLLETILRFRKLKYEMTRIKNIKHWETWILFSNKWEEVSPIQSFVGSLPSYF